MSYPPPWRVEQDHNAALDLMRAHPLGHLFTSHNGQRVTRVPFVVDESDGVPSQLRAHVNAQNPQAVGLDGAQVLAVFSGPAAYVSPNWRVDKSRGGTYDFEQVTVSGTARVVEGIEPFRQLIDDLSILVETQHALANDAPVWRVADAAEGYFERLTPHVTQFVIEIDSIETVSKLHQQFPEEDRRSIAEHLERRGRDDSDAIAAKIRASL